MMFVKWTVKTVARVAAHKYQMTQEGKTNRPPPVGDTRPRNASDASGRLAYGFENPNVIGFAAGLTQEQRRH